MLHTPGFYYVKKPKRFVILSSDKSSERNLSCFFDIIKPRSMEHLQSEEPFSSDPYFRSNYILFLKCGFVIGLVVSVVHYVEPTPAHSDTSWFNDSLSSSSKDASTIIMLIRLMLHLSVMNTNKVILRHSFGFGY